MSLAQIVRLRRDQVALLIEILHRHRESIMRKNRWIDNDFMRNEEKFIPLYIEKYRPFLRKRVSERGLTTVHGVATHTGAHLNPRRVFVGRFALKDRVREKRREKRSSAGLRHKYFDRRSMLRTKSMSSRRSIETRDLLLLFFIKSRSFARISCEYVMLRESAKGSEWKKGQTWSDAIEERRAMIRGTSRAKMPRWIVPECLVI